MTDVATRPGAEDAPTNDATHALDAAGEPVDGDATTQNLEWAPADPPRRKRHWGLWLGIPAGIVAVSLVASSLILIAPGTSVASVPVGGLTPGAAADALAERLAATTVVLTSAEGSPELSAADLGATLDARALAERAHAEHPMWNVSTWNGDPSTAAVRIDAEAATAALRDAAPSLFTDPVDATIAFDATTAWFAATPDVPGSGVSVEAVRLALQSALARGEARVELDTAAAVAIPAITSTASAEAQAASLNTMLDTAGFYVGEERTVPIDRAVAASWISVAPAGDGTFAITADPAAIQPVVDGLAPLVNRAAADGKVITDSGGRVLREDAPGISGRELGDTSSVASDFATQLSTTGNGSFALPVNEVAPVIVSVARRIEVDLGAQRTYLFENGNVVQSYAISSGLSGTPTPTGNFRVFAHTRIQDLGALCYNPEAVNSYCTKDVPWLTWFAPDIAFHGAYWHNNFGTPMSHGCVNMPINVAKFVYDWSPEGTEVWVHS